ncbi:MAG: DUF6798 domain-containing protein [Planctomycetota bacterium]
MSIANQIQVHLRLAHHLHFGSFATIGVALFCFQVFAWLWLSQYSMLRDNQFKALYFYVNTSLMISLVGLLLSGLADEKGIWSTFANSLLRYYWFRFSDFAIPLGLSIACGLHLSKMLESENKSKQRLGTISAVCMGLAVLASIGQDWLKVGGLRSEADQSGLPTYPENRSRTDQTSLNWFKVCDWIRVNTRTDTCFLTPTRQQTFKWYAHRPEFVTWKDCPQNAEKIIEWRQRYLIATAIEQNVAGAGLGFSPEQLQQLHREHGITHLLAPQSQEDVAIKKGVLSIKQLTKVYPADPEARSTYVVYKINNDFEQVSDD